MRKLSILLLTFFLALLPMGCKAQNPISPTLSDNLEGPQPVKIVTTLFPQYDFAKAIGQDKVEVTLLLPSGVEAHSYEPTPRDIVTIQGADLFIYTGEVMEPWAHKTLEGIATDQLKVVDVSKNIALINAEGEHASDEGEHEEHVHELAATDFYEWSGAFHLTPGQYQWTFAKVDGSYAEETMLLGLTLAENSTEEGLEKAHKRTEQVFLNLANHVDVGGIIKGEEGLYHLVFDASQEISTYNLTVEKEGVYLFFAEHNPIEFEAGEHFLKDSDGFAVEAIGDSHEEHAHSGETHEDHNHGTYDPHFWTDPNNAMIMVDTVLEALVGADPANAAFYTANAESYKAELEALDTLLVSEISTLENKTIIHGGHFAFGYFAKRYGLNYVSPYVGFSPDSEPTGQKIREMIDLMDTLGVKAIFYEELIDPKVARVIAEEGGAQLLLLHGAHNVSKDELQSGLTYIIIMKENLERLKAGLSGE